MSRFVLFSSVIAASSNRGQPSYAMISIGSDLFVSFRNRIGSCGSSTSLGAIAAVGYAARFSVSCLDNARQCEVSFDHTVRTFGLVVSNVATNVVVTVISGLCIFKMEDELDEICWGVHAQSNVNPQPIVSRDLCFVSGKVLNFDVQSQ